MPEADSIKTHYRTCHLCEAMCGLEIRTRGDKVLSIKGDEQDVYSKGHICSKGAALQDIHTDRDRLKYPIQKAPPAQQQQSEWCWHSATSWLLSVSNIRR
ncbi:MAG: hypothetical protein H6558_22860 [Lewinellaceae bacterium]|nr:hypothetical protein [Phaeodactylibacter sp.]MCB0561656.1 hypothetical protein [Phaeodactylibacter sp.]MCB9267874.1 hypothetical protein [Lewinellaceae bacterium]MCB9348792.1 hypothetical protein [Lewinellaceae bacterium]